MTMVVCNFSFFFASYVFIKSSHILAGIYFIFQKDVLEGTRNSCKTKFGPQRKDRKSCFQVRQIAVLFSNLVALILG